MNCICVHNRCDIYLESIFTVHLCVTKHETVHYNEYCYINYTPYKETTKLRFKSMINEYHENISVKIENTIKCLLSFEWVSNSSLYRVFVL